MFKRLFFATVGLGAGVAVGVWAVRKIEATQAKLTPEHAARVTTARAEGLRGRVAAAMAAARIAAADKDAELREIYRGRQVLRAEIRAQPLGVPPAGAPPAAPPPAPSGAGEAT